MERVLQTDDKSFIKHMYLLFLEYAPDDVMVRNNLGHALILEGHLEEAREHLLHALKLAPTNEHLIGNLALTEPQ